MGVSIHICGGGFANRLDVGKTTLNGNRDDMVLQGLDALTPADKNRTFINLETHPFKLTRRMYRLTFTKINILMEDTNDSTLIGVKHGGTSDYIKVIYFMIIYA
ncbi:hypothetical protein ACA910_009044 [Epithemia clementina (nom. ined.)]